jgi:hypothetical protein
MTSIAVYLHRRREVYWEFFVNVSFGAFMSGLVGLLVSLYSGLLVL